MIRYPNGEIYKPEAGQGTKKRKPVALDNFAKRGMGLEDDLNSSSDVYNAQGRCLIYKRPTPIRVVRMDKLDKSKITLAYFAAKSTTDYNGLYRGKYLDFEAKETINKTSFAFANIRPQQITHLQGVKALGGLAFFVIRMKAYGETYLLDCGEILSALKENSRKSFPYSLLKEKGILIKEGFSPRLMYLDAVDQLYFKD
ncbi:MAG: Holliday junction resolvase RecU [Bacilli bacterium]|jgi:recombination protein U|nr:Holliday junction resolvase RecU [Bacilli bacterium]